MAADRLMQLYFTLAAGGTMTAEEIADRLGVSKPTVHAGLSVEGLPNVGYRVDNPPEMPPLFLTAAEFRALATGAKTVVTGSDRALSRAAGDLLAKARSLVPPRSRGKYGL
jgi:predicted DNA-binding transcriptional regulator YafY